MKEWTIYHNSRCSKSRAALALLRSRGVEPHIVEYLKTPPDAKTVGELLKKLGMRAREIVRDSEDEYQQLKLDNPDRGDAELIAAIVAHPILLQRPIIVRGDRAVVGRPPENVLKLL